MMLVEVSTLRDPPLIYSIMIADWKTWYSLFPSEEGTHVEEKWWP